MEPLSLAERVSARLGEIRGVTAVSLGGSRARGAAGSDSDIDLGIYYRAASPPSPSLLRQLARELHSGHSAAEVTEHGEWGPWVNGGAWLRIDGLKVDWLYRDLERVSDVIGDCVSGIIT